MMGSFGGSLPRNILKSLVLMIAVALVGAFLLAWIFSGSEAQAKVNDPTRNEIQRGDPQPQSSMMKRLSDNTFRLIREKNNLFHANLELDEENQHLGEAFDDLARAKAELEEQVELLHIQLNQLEEDKLLAELDELLADSYIDSEICDNQQDDDGDMFIDCDDWDCDISPACGRKHREDCSNQQDDDGDDFIDCADWDCDDNPVCKKKINKLHSYWH